jgi:hypothetical protein
MFQYLILILGAILPSFFVYFLNKKNEKNGVYIDRLPIYYFIGNSLSILCLTIFSEEDVFLFIFFANVVFYISYWLYVKSNSKQSSKLEYSEFNLAISSCPHCKGPNEKNMKICEWCGGTIF